MVTYVKIKWRCINKKIIEILNLDILLTIEFQKVIPRLNVKIKILDICEIKS